MNFSPCVCAPLRYIRWPGFGGWCYTQSHIVPPPYVSGLESKAASCTSFLPLCQAKASLWTLARRLLSHGISEFARSKHLCLSTQLIPMIATAHTGPADNHFASFLTQLKAPPATEQAMRADGAQWAVPSPSRPTTTAGETSTTTSQPLPSFTFDHSTHNYYASTSALPSRPASSFSTPTGYYSHHVGSLRDQHATSAAPSWSASTYPPGASGSLGDYLHQHHAPPPPALHPLLHHSEALARPNEEDLAIDAQMLREVLQEMPTGQTPVGAPHATQPRGPPMPGLQLLFGSPMHSTELTAAPSAFYSSSMGMTTASADMLLTMRETAPGASIYASGPSPDQTLAGTLPLSSGLSTAYDPLAATDGHGTGPASLLARKKRATATRICKVEGCTKGIRSRGLCKAHGGGRRCTTPGCTTSDQGGGHCVLHGGGRRCRIEGCKKSAQWRGVCKMHGGARRCRYGQCTKNGQVKQGYCRMHHNLLTAQRQQQEQLQAQQLHVQQLQPPPPLPPVVVKTESL